MIVHKLKYYLGLALVLALAMSCDKEQSLQEYYIDSKENDNFVMLNVPASLLSPQTDKLSQDQQEVLKTVQKINILALPLDEATKGIYPVEKLKVQDILARDGYDELMSMGKPSQRMRFYLRGETESIDEVVVFALDDHKGFVLARVIGNDMNIAKMVRLAETIEHQDSTKTTQFEGILDIFSDK